MTFNVLSPDELNVGKTAAVDGQTENEALHTLLSRSIWSSSDAKLYNKKMTSGGAAVALSPSESTAPVAVPVINNRQSVCTVSSL